MKKRIIIILYIISFVISLFILAWFLTNASADVAYDAYSNYVEDGGRIYYSRNLRNRGLIFDLAKSGKVSKIFSSKSEDMASIREISVFDDSIYAVLSDMDDEGEEYYRIFELDRKLVPIAKTASFTLPDEEILSGFSAEKSGLFLTVLRKDGSYARVYGIDRDYLADITDDDKDKDKDDEEGKKEEDTIYPETVVSRRSSEDRFFSQAEYAFGKLYVRTDADLPEGRFGENADLREAISNMKLGMGQFLSLYSDYFIWYVAGLLIWFILLYLILNAVLFRNRTAYFLIVAELILAVTIGIGVYTVAKVTKDSREEEYTRFAVLTLSSLEDEAGLNEYALYSLDKFYDSPRYQEIREEIADFMEEDGNRNVFYDILGMRLQDNLVIVSASGRNLQGIGTIYGQAMEDLSGAIYRGNDYASEDIMIQGQNYRAVAIADDETTPDYALVGVINATSTDGHFWEDGKSAYIIFLVIFAAGSALIFLIWWLQVRDFRNLETALADTAYGRSVDEHPAVVGADLKDMWDSVIEIGKRIEGIEYNRIRTLEAYYRFAPKNVDRILGKGSMLEVANGDRIALRGTCAMMGIDARKEGNLRRIADVFDKIGSYQKDHAAVTISKTPDMSRMQLFFLEQEQNTVKFFTELFQSSSRVDNEITYSAFLHFDACTFGVMGTEEEASAWLSASTQPAIEMITTFATNLKLGLVISKEIRDREQVQSPLRYIGCFDAGTGMSVIELYEVLDTLPSAQRNGRIRALPKFEEAMKLYYDKDFYFARTRFSEILKEQPDDLLVKWYVFESDRYLNEGIDGEGYRMLHN